MKVLYNANIYTQDSNKTKASALIISNGRIQATGSDAEIMAEVRPGWQTENMEGRTILPGMTDSHMHLEFYSQMLQTVACETPTRQELLQNVAAFAQKTPKGQWIWGFGWNQNVWPEGYGNASLLDEVAPDHPVFLSSKSGHASWANSLALKIAGISAQTPNPEGGVIMRDEAGNPTGILLEAADLVSKFIPPPTMEQQIEAVKFAQSTLHQMGLTGLHDYDTPALFQVLQKLDLEELLQLRIVKGIPVEMIDHAIAAGLRSGFGSEKLRTGSLKLFADGALGPQTAAMLDPYEGTTADRGIALLSKEQVFDIGRKAVMNGLSLATHAIGDLANRVILDGYEEIRNFEKQNGLPPLRHRIEHVQLLHPDDCGRLAKMGIIASMQPIHATSDIYISDRHWGKRAAGAYIFKTLLDLGTHLAFGSDAPVETPNPFVGLHAAVTRRRADGSPNADGWHPEQRLTLQQALDGYTLGAAYASGQENRLGKLAPGYFADLIVLENDVFTYDPQEIHTIQPLATMVGGKWVWNKA